MRSILAAAAAAVLATAVNAQAALLDDNWTQQLNWSGNLAVARTGLGWAPDGSDRLFVTAKNGTVHVFSGALGTGTGTWSVFATEAVYTASECGLIGMAFDPDFARNHYVYFFLTVSATEQQIVRYDASGATGTGRTVIVAGLPTRGQNHDGGALGFGPDGKLYWAIGDQGNRTGVDADLSLLAAKVGRANRDGSNPGDNPFDDGVGPNNDFIWARGFRNPFTLAFQPGTGALWLNVVGDGYEQVFRVAAGDHGGYDDFENNQPGGYLAPKIAYRTNGVDTRNFTGTLARRDGVATYTTTAAHGFRVGTSLGITGTADPSFGDAANRMFVASTPTPSSFTIAQPGLPDADTTGGSATTLDQGGSLTGGTFYDATLAPPEYRGNFFYGDFNSGRIMRARLDASGETVQGVEHWADGLGTQLDIATGPDGALYYLGYTGGGVNRAAYDASEQGIVVSNQHLRADERGAVVVGVRLALAPEIDVEVAVARTAGDADVHVESGAALLFTPGNWMRPQYVTIAAQGDPDTADDQAGFEFSSAGLEPVGLEISVLDLGVMAGDAVFADGFED